MRQRTTTTMRIGAHQLASAELCDWPQAQPRRGNATEDRDRNRRHRQASARQMRPPTAVVAAAVGRGLQGAQPQREGRPMTKKPPRRKPQGGQRERIQCEQAQRRMAPQQVQREPQGPQRGQAASSGQQPPPCRLPLPLPAPFPPGSSAAWVSPQVWAGARVPGGRTPVWRCWAPRRRAGSPRRRGGRRPHALPPFPTRFRAARCGCRTPRTGKRSSSSCSRSGPGVGQRKGDRAQADKEWPHGEQLRAPCEH